MGARIAIYNRRSIGGEPAGDVEVRRPISSARRSRRRRSRRSSTSFRSSPSRRVTRAARPSFAARRAAREGVESLEAVVEELRRIGGHIRATRDGFRIKGVPARLRGRVVDSRGTIGWRCSARRGRRVARGSRAARRRGRRTSFPGFFDVLEQSLRCRSLPSRDMIVAIDGPAGSGKSTVASTLARRLGLPLPRHRRDVSRADVDRRARRRRPRRRSGARRLALEHPVSFGLDGRVEIDGEDVTRRDPGRRDRPARPDRRAASGGARGDARAAAALAVGGDSVIEGRDIGSVVVPTPSEGLPLAMPTRRARRGVRGPPGLPERCGRPPRRDERDAVNTKPADDAVRLDTTSLTVDEVVDRIADLVEATR
jgi:cytidylate kinase